MPHRAFTPPIKAYNWMAGIGLGAIANCKGKMKMDRETEGKEGNP